MLDIATALVLALVFAMGFLFGLLWSSDGPKPDGSVIEPIYGPDGRIKHIRTKA